MSGPRLSEKVKREIIIAYGRGVPVGMIAQQFGIHESYPGVLARRRGIARTGGPRPADPSKSLRTQVTPYLSEKALELYHKGLDIPDIAHRLRCTFATAAHGLAEAVERERIEATQRSYR